MAHLGTAGPVRALLLSRFWRSEVHTSYPWALAKQKPLANLGDVSLWNMVKHTRALSVSFHCGGCPWLAWKSMEHGLVPFSMDWVWDTTWSTSGPQLPSWQHDPESNVGTCRHSLATGHSVSYDRCDILWHCTKHWEFMKLLLNITKWHWHAPTLLTSTLVHCPNHQTPLPYSATHPRHWWPALVRMTCAQQTEALWSLVTQCSQVTGYMDVYGCIWMYMDVYGCIWMYGCICMYMDVYGCIWLYMDVYGCIWMYMHVYGCIWMYMHVYGCICTYMDV